MDKQQRVPLRPWSRAEAVRPTPTELVFRSLFDSGLRLAGADTAERLLSAKASRVQLIGEACSRVGTSVYIHEDADAAAIYGDDGRQLARIWFERELSNGTVSVRWELSEEASEALKRWLDENR